MGKRTHVSPWTHLTEESSRVPEEGKHIPLAEQSSHGCPAVCALPMMDCALQTCSRIDPSTCVLPH